MKIHSKDYLNDYKIGKEPWLVMLIDFAVSTNGKISEKQFKDVYESLLSGQSKDLSLNAINSVSEEIRLIRLTHNSGVNALAPGESILFSKDCTLLYGMNGAGKSSYFKILNEIAGGNEKKRVLQNIYSESSSIVDVKLEYSNTTNKELIVWNGSSRNLHPINQSRVFDTSYLSGLLNERLADSTLVEPLGLHLFSCIISKMDEIKIKLKEEAGSLKSLKPKIDTHFMRDVFVNAFARESFLPDLKSELELQFGFTDQELELIEIKEKTIEDLKKNNIQDKIKLEQSLIFRIRDIDKKITDMVARLVKANQVSMSIIESYHVLTKKSNDFRDNMTILKSIPNSSTPEWKVFIESAHKCKTNDLDIVCPYCQQEYDTNALQLVVAYNEFLSNKSESELKLVNQEAEKAIKTLNDMRLTIDFDIDIADYLINLKIKDILYVKTIQTVIEKIEIFRQALIDALENKSHISELEILELGEINQVLNHFLNQKETHINFLQKESSDKEEKIKELEKELLQLKEKKSISEQKPAIIDWFQKHDQAEKLLVLSSSINSGSLTNESKKAHSELLTENLKKCFEEELKYIFGRPKFEVSLVGGKGGKGTSSTKLVIKQNNNIHEILSEGEQKAVGLALFLAEIKTQHTNNPIILDDPVNSLDHKISANFAERLLELENQIIVFTHNKLFVDAFEATKKAHICKNHTERGCNQQKKHIYYYNVQSDGRDANGIIVFTMENRFANYLTNAKKLLGKTPFIENNKTASLIRKSIECIVDEVILNGITPTKMSNKNSRINWEGLKQIKSQPANIDKLNLIHSRCSGGELHNGTECDENPIEKQEFLDMITEIETIITIYKPKT